MENSGQCLLNASRCWQRNLYGMTMEGYRFPGGKASTSWQGNLCAMFVELSWLQKRTPLERLAFPILDGRALSRPAWNVC
jgi:hypothetical protein